MLWQHKQIHHRKEIAKTGFLTSVASYVGFWFLDLLKPGFVSRYVSVHIFLLVAVIFGLWWAREMKEYTERPTLQALIAIVSGLALSVLLWGASEGLDTYRTTLVVIGFVLPLFILRVLKT